MVDAAKVDMESLLEPLGYSVLCLRDDSRLTIAYASRSFYRALGYREGELSVLRAPGPAPVLRNDPPIDWGRVKEEIAANGCAKPELRLIKKDGHHIWMDFRTSFSREFRGGCFCGVASDVTLTRRSLRMQREQALALRQKAERDLLTGLYNRMTTMSLVNEALAKSGPADRHALFVVDIDNFKKVNDRLGHLAGDRLIVRTASTLRRQFREEDIVGRVGGDEFVVFLKNINLQAVLSKAELLLRLIQKLPAEREGRVPVSGSIGIALYPADGRAYEELFRRADNALYAAKNSGKNSFRVYVKGIEAIAHNGEKY